MCYTTLRKTKPNFHDRVLHKIVNGLLFNSDSDIHCDLDIDDIVMVIKKVTAERETRLQTTLTH